METVYARLGDQDSVKGVSVKWRQTLNGQGVFGRNAERSEAVLPEFLKVSGSGQPQLSELSLDGNLPRSSRTDEDDVATVENRIPCRHGQLWVIVYCPQEYVGIKQEIHRRLARP